MKIRKMHLVNFRCFQESEVDFESQLTVFVSNNGAGKTAVLDAVAYGLARYIRGLPGIRSPALKFSDIRITNNEVQADGCVLGWTAQDAETLIIWASIKKSDRADPVKLKKSSEQLVKNLVEAQPTGPKRIVTMADYVSDIMERHRADAAFELPVVVFYGTDRVVRKEIQRRRGFKKVFTRFDALQDSMFAETHFKKAFEWFNAIEDEERRDRIRLKDLGYEDPRVAAVRLAVERLLPDKHFNLRTEAKPLRLVIDRKLADGPVKTFRISQLSDGVRVILGMAMDLSRRMIEANPHLEPTQALQSSAIVLIDEIDLHLHPSWQQKVLDGFMSAFPNAQFIVSTHSPQVLSAVPADSLRVIKFEETSESSHPPESELSSAQLIIRDEYSFLKGAQAQYILETIFAVPARAPHLESTKNLERYKNMISEGTWDTPEGQELREKIDAWGAGFEAELGKLDIEIRLKRHERKKLSKDDKS
ncbi:AAA family ATPase [Cereibacter johrii]|uniref:AAA family ATPase n=1 Tax=Cereibacter johrii TaxID=445629 RepID=UPI002B2179DB|nr:AAA family ATPase [Cereibacter johrii]MEA5163527.1 AAA family ATPase [Cereibacter johrii]